MADGIRQLSDPSLPWPSDEQILADLEGGGSEAALAILLGRMRLLGQDHGPDDWPAVQMRDITALCDAAMRRHTNAELNRLRALLAQAEEVLERAASTLVQPGTPTPQFCESVSADIRRALAAVREGRR